MRQSLGALWAPRWIKADTLDCVSTLPRCEGYFLQTEPSEEYRDGQGINMMYWWFVGSQSLVNDSKRKEENEAKIHKSALQCTVLLLDLMSSIGKCYLFKCPKKNLFKLSLNLGGLQKCFHFTCDLVPSINRHIDNTKWKIAAKTKIAAKAKRSLISTQETWNHSGKGDYDHETMCWRYPNACKSASAFLPKWHPPAAIVSKPIFRWRWWLHYRNAQHISHNTSRQSES